MPRSSVSALVPAGLSAMVGIVNITEESFSDGGRYLAAREPQDAKILTSPEGA